LAALVVVVEIDGDGEPAVRRAQHRIVPMGLEMAAILGGITTDDIALHASDLEMVDLCNLRGKPPDKTRLRFENDVLVFDVIISAPLKTVIRYADGLAADVARDPDFVAAMRLVNGDELLAELRFEKVRQHDDRRWELKPGKPRGRRQPIQIGVERDDVTAIL